MLVQVAQTRVQNIAQFIRPSQRGLLFPESGARLKLLVDVSVLQFLGFLRFHSVIYVTARGPNLTTLLLPDELLATTVQLCRLVFEPVGEPLLLIRYRIVRLGYVAEPRASAVLSSLHLVPQWLGLVHHLHGSMGFGRVNNIY